MKTPNGRHMTNAEMRVIICALSGSACGSVIQRSRRSSEPYGDELTAVEDRLVEIQHAFGLLGSPEEADQ